MKGVGGANRGRWHATVEDGWDGEGVFNYTFLVRYMLNIALALYADELCLRRTLIEAESTCVLLM